MSDHEKVAGIDPGVIRRVMVARYQYAIAADQGRQHGDAALMTAISTLQDSVELFLNAAADHTRAETKSRAEFDKLFDAVDVKVSGALPLRQRMVTMNKVRVQSKHNGVVPNRSEVVGAIADALRFFEGASQAIFGVPLYAINLISQIKRDDIRGHLSQAQTEFDAGRYADTLIECRKAIYLVFERYANIDPNSAGGGMLFWPRYSADWARQASHLNGVNEPAEFIAMDRQLVDADLVALGLDPVVFWSIIHMTPGMFHHPERGWVVKREFHVFAEDSAARDRAAYVLDNTTDFLLRWESRTASRRFAPFFGAQEFKVAAETTMVYRKADTTSQPLGTLNRGETVRCVHLTPGLKDDTMFAAIYMSRQSVAEALIGLGNVTCYVLRDDIDFTPILPPTAET